MSRLIDIGLEQLASVVFRMGELAHKTVSLSLNGYIEGTNYYEEVHNLSDMLITMADEAEDKAFELIARFQPVASDLRILKSYMKITYDFARYGRYALDIAQIYSRLGGLKECEDWIKQSIRHMSEKVLSMVRTSVDSLKSHDTNLAEILSETEKQVDSMYFEYLDRLVEKAPATNRCTISSVLVVRYLERIADHATYIGESIIYLATGEKIILR
ncbi:MAG: phosphate signaling complex protein PhoU [Candidatus Bathyarchaeia archaeon]|nr:phosphate signaling complex protein PhoU [Candidatus Bathyarchaeota archaeon A05DMB-4]